jgi:hypothetical protein
MDPAQISFLNSITVATAAMICVVILWRSLNEERKQHIQDLRDFLNKDNADLKVRVLMIEDKLGMPRVNHAFGFSDEFDKPELKPQKAYDKTP